MKRQAIFFSLVLLVLLRLGTQKVQSVEPLPISGGVPNQLTPLTPNQEKLDDASTNINFNAQMGSDLETPTFPFSDALKETYKYLYPLDQIENIKTYENPEDEPKYTISGKTALCITLPGGTTVRVGSLSPFATKPLTKLRDYIFGAKSTAFLGHEDVKPNDEGLFQFLPPSQIQAKDALCGESGSGSEIPSEAATVEKQYTPLSWSRIFSSLTGIAGAFASNTLLSNVDDLKSIENQAKTYVPLSVDATDGKNDGTITTTSLLKGKTVSMNIPDQAKNEAAMNAIYCSLVSKADRGKIGLTDEDCQREELGSCKSKLPDLSISDASCAMKNTNTIKNYVDNKNSIEGDDLPPTMKAIINKAADTFKVPASSILATLYHEGGFSRSYIQWTEANVRKWSFCGQEMDFCNKDEVSEAQSPYGWIPAWFYNGDGEGALWNAVQEVDPSRNSKDKVSPCNFLDATFATAKALSRGAAQRPPAVKSLTTCFGSPITNNKIPTSCSSWTNAQIFQSHVSYAGYCPEPGKSAQYPPQPNYKVWVDRWYKAF